MPPDDPLEGLVLEDDPLTEEELAAAELALRDGQLLPGIGDETIHLSEEEKTWLAALLTGLCRGYEDATADWRKRLRDIRKAYNLVGDPARQGQSPGAQRMVSELTRADVNVASARITEGLTGADPPVAVQVANDQAEDIQTQELTKLAEEITAFFNGYGAVTKRDTWQPLLIQRTVKEGNCVHRRMWVTEKFSYKYLAEGGKIKGVEEERGRIRVDLIPNEQVVVYPPWETDPEQLDVMGHRSPMAPHEFRAFAKEKNIPEKEMLEIVADAKSGVTIHENQQENLADMDIDVANLNPFDGQIQVTELWCYLPVKEDGEAIRFQVFLYEPLEKILWIGHNVLHSVRRHPYFLTRYWVEDGAFWGSGVGHETIFAQAAKSALLNLLIDNLKMTANHVRLIRKDSPAEALQDQISPGYNIPVDEPSDFTTVKLGGELTEIYQALDLFDLMAMKVTGITSPIQGFGDPVLKSGASPSSLALLVEHAGKKFGQVDRNIREGLSQAYFFDLELLQQYAPEGVFYDILGPEAEFGTQRFRAPKGDLRKLLRIRATAPSATTAKEILRQNVMLAYNLWQNHMQALLALAEQAWGQENPARVTNLKLKLLRFTHELFSQIIRLLDIPGLTGKLPALGGDLETEQEERENSLLEQVQELSGILQQLQEQQQQGAPQDAESMGAPSGGPGPQGLVPAPEGLG